MPSKMVTVAPASATSTVPVMVCAAWLIGPPGLPIATTGAVVSSVKLSARGGRAIAGHIAELRRHLLAAVGPEVARGHASG